MSGSEPESAEAVLTENDKILAVGSLEAVQAAAESGKHQDTPILKDLKGAVMLPAFIDSHSHITAVARVLSFAMLQEAESFDGIIGILNRFKEERKLEPGDWIIGTGYDHNNLKEGRHPDRFILDAAFSENPVMVTHASGHMGVANSLALEQLGRQLQAAEQLYLKHGITTIQDGRTGKEEWKLLKYAAEQGLLHADVVAYAALNDAHELTEENPAYTGAYCNHLRIGGYKIFLDGSPQGRTAWVSRPYEGEPEGYCGYPIFKDKEVQSYFETAFREGRQLLVHCNGDAAAQQMIGACRMAADTTGQDPAKTRPVMIHAQLVRPDQLKEMERLSITASFFTAHTWYWGDVHLKNFGEARALKISPARTAIDDGVNVTFHQDSPVIQPDMLETVWCAVNRISSGGHPMGLMERVTPYEALKAVTSNAAYQYGEENEKGTIEPGKTADFVILSASPLTVLPEEIKKIRVLETIKGGKVLYKSI